jgi:hypothetical protein
MQAYIASTAEPTRLDPESPRRPPSSRPSALTDKWILRVRLKSGKWRRYKATTREIIQKLRAGKMPSGVEAGQVGNDFQPLASYPAFKEIAPAPKNGRVHAPLAAALSDSSLMFRRAESRRHLYLWFIAAALAFFLVGFAVLLFILAY